MAKTQPTDAVGLLKADHRKVEGLFAQYEKARDTDRKRALAEEICTELTVHAQIEEEIFYPGCEEAVKEDLYDEAYVEHDGAKVLIAEITASSPSDGFYDAKVTVPSEIDQASRQGRGEAGEGFFAQARKGGVARKRSAPGSAPARPCCSNRSKRPDCRPRRPAPSSATSSSKVAPSHESVDKLPTGRRRQTDRPVLCRRGSVDRNEAREPAPLSATRGPPAGPSLRTAPQDGALRPCLCTGRHEALLRMARRGQPCHPGRSLGLDLRRLPSRQSRPGSRFKRQGIHRDPRSRPDRHRQPGARPHVAHPHHGQ